MTTTGTLPRLLRLLVTALALAPAGAFRPATRGVFAARTRPVAAASEDESGLLSWQEGLARALSPFAPIAERQLMVQDLVGRREEVLRDIQDAVATGSPEELLPPDSELKRAAVGARAVQRQVVEDLLPAAAAAAPTVPNTLLQSGPDLVARLTESATKLASPDALRDVAGRLPELPNLVAEEAASVFMSTPPGLETPNFVVLDSQDGFEVREYETFSVCSVQMDEKATPEDPSTAGESFNTLASYLFGENDQSTSMKMTTPVSIDYTVGQLPSMSFVLPSGVDAASAPQPNSPRVTLTDVVGEGRRVAAVEFPGFATDGEVERQLSGLKRKLLEAGYQMQDDQAYQVLQYNPPYTLPFLRRNELVVTLMGSSAPPALADEPTDAEPSAEADVSVEDDDTPAPEPEAPVDEAEDMEDDGMPSD